jgi:hypothetical protein
MMAESGLRIRGGISFGKAYIDEAESVFVGNPIVEAYQLEKKQQWAGVALTQSAVAKIPERARSGHLADWWVIPYDVPLKERDDENARDKLDVGRAFVLESKLDAVE